MDIHSICSLKELKIVFPESLNSSPIEQTHIEITDYTQAHVQSLIFVSDSSYLKKIKKLELDSKVAVMVTTPGLWENESAFFKNSSCVTLVSSSMPKALSALSYMQWQERVGKLNQMVDSRQMGSSNIHPSTKIAQGVFVGENVEIEKGCVIHSGVRLMGDIKIGEDTVIYPNTVIYPRVNIGKRCRVHAQVSIGSDGFGYKYEQGVHYKLWHSGGVEIGDDVEIGANSCIDGGTYSPSIIGNGTKLDNQVQVAHNVQLGQGVILCGQVAIAGSAKIGEFCVFGGKAAVADGVTVGAASQIAGNCMVTSSWPAKSSLGGHPARPLNEWMRSIVVLKKLSAKNQEKK